MRVSVVISDNYRKIDRDVGDDSYAFPDNKFLKTLPVPRQNFDMDIKKL